MLSTEEWWGILEAYGAKVWPAQAVFFVAGKWGTGINK